ncbi:MAG: aminotransferase class V-fold PLP-dependent enzyme, partial [Oscillospiraceae bacterium]|nr:aminotransferase class V-fold PLP-dependent enzyme [Oscillospiraceae bacterium]
MEKRYIYADNAATTAVSDAVLAEMLPYFKEHYGNPSSIYALGRENERAIIDARARVAKCLGAQPNEIF